MARMNEWVKQSHLKIQRFRLAIVQVKWAQWKEIKAFAMTCKHMYPSLLNSPSLLPLCRKVIDQPPVSVVLSLRQSLPPNLWLPVEDICSAVTASNLRPLIGSNLGQKAPQLHNRRCPTHPRRRSSAEDGSPRESQWGWRKASDEIMLTWIMCYLMKRTESTTRTIIKRLRPKIKERCFHGHLNTEKWREFWATA